MAETVSYVLQFTIREGRLDDLRALVDELVASAQNEPGTLSYEWFLGADETTCHIYERYADSAAVLAHLGTFGAVFAERFLACAEPTGLHVYGDPSADVREVLDGLGATYLEPFGGFAR